MTDLPDTIRVGRCDTGRPLCGAPARFTAAGWRCKDHRPRDFHRTDTPTDTRKETTT